MSYYRAECHGCEHMTQGRDESPCNICRRMFVDMHTKKYANIKEE